MKTKNVLITLGMLAIVGITYDQLARNGYVPKLCKKKVETKPEVATPETKPESKPVVLDVIKPVNPATGQAPETNRSFV